MIKTAALALAIVALVGCSNDAPNDPNDVGKGVAKEGRSIKMAAGAGAPGGSAPSGAAPSAE